MEVKKSEKHKYYSRQHSCKTCGKSFSFKSRFMKRFIQGKKHMNVIFVKRPLSKVVAYLRKHTEEKECDIFK